MSRNPIVLPKGFQIKTIANRLRLEYDGTGVLAEQPLYSEFDFCEYEQCINYLIFKLTEGIKKGFIHVNPEWLSDDELLIEVHNRGLRT